MAPALIDSEHIQDVLSNVSLKGQNGHANGNTTSYAVNGPVTPTGALDKYDSFDLTPVIGREFPDANLVDWLQSSNADELLKELAYTISSRGVVFFRKQDNLTNDLQKALIQRLGELSGKPSTSTLHIHPVLNSEDEMGEDREADNEISTISSKLFKKIYIKEDEDTVCTKKQSSNSWHSDIAFEPVPADYTSLRLTQLPKLGGDTVWASGYEIYDRLSPLYQKFVESLSCTFAQPNFNAIAKRGGFKIYDKPRGAPENVGSVLKAVHPVVRTNPVTGWKSIYPVGAHISHINALTKEESKSLLDWFNQLCVDNHDLQVRFKWQNVNDIAIWDNRSTFHNATYDFEGLGDRSGNRAVGLGERPFFDPESSSRREALEREGVVAGKYFM
ncbi:hypothetical protein LTR36_003950 [Oleoguttula mirabilis]|uniref:TauD/TfdA-like domain-containing protein n=1 Tax=Oleoguttula mirabilis TaxID=1507867 RepID=A0AAV9JIK5_9PEZI|nr:hypothetical protein LTR36_003950 [Oleoguttula mirabilis]